jgi:antitoxin component YwqK of YwqJK toxin-antitoxin module
MLPFLNFKKFDPGVISFPKKTLKEKNVTFMKTQHLIIALCTLLFSCNNLETVEKKGPNGQILEKYTINKGTGTQEGLYQSFHPNGKIFRESNYVNGKLHGVTKTYYESGALESTETMQNGIFEGPYQKFYENGKVSNEGQYANNEMSGVWKRYFESGELMEEVNFAKNEENGPFRFYHKNGKLSIAGNFLDGEYEHGDLQEYDENGTLNRKMRCYLGVCLTTWTPEEGDIAIDTARLKELGDAFKAAE